MNWRQRQADKRSVKQAWYAAALGGWRKVPALQEFMREQFPPDPDTEDGAREIENQWRGWAARNGLKVQKLKQEEIEQLRSRLERRETVH